MKIPNTNSLLRLSKLTPMEKISRFLVDKQAMHITLQGICWGANFFSNHPVNNIQSFAAYKLAVDTFECASAAFSKTHVGISRQATNVFSIATSATRGLKKLGNTLCK